MKHSSISKWVKNRLKSFKGESLGEEIRREAVSLLDQALAQSRSSQRNDKDPIHDIRVVLKRLRAYWRLLRYGVDKGTYKEADARIRLTGKRLAGQRDQDVLADCLRALQEELTPPQQQWTQTWIEQLKPSVGDSQPVAASESDWQAVIEALEDERAAWQSLEGLDHFDKALRKGLGKSLERNVDLADNATAKKASPEDRHRWRKWVKYSFYQLKLFKFLGAKVPKQTRKGLDQLGEQLGTEHDFWVLNDQLESRKQAAVSPEETEVIEGVIQANRKRIKQLRKRTDHLYRSWAERF